MNDSITVTYTTTLEEHPSGVVTFTGEDNLNQFRIYMSDNGIIKRTLTIFFYIYLKTCKIDGVARGDMDALFSTNIGTVTSYLEEVDLSGLDVSNISSMTDVFKDSKKLVKLFGLESFDTSNVTSMKNMFRNCQLLDHINVNNFNLSNCSDTSGMFYGCTALNKIYCNNTWTPGTVSDSTSMFELCDSLSGAISYDSTKIDITYANPTTGYFTRIPFKFNNSDVNAIKFNNHNVSHLNFNGNQIF